MSINMSFTINATTAHEISRGIRELAAILDASARDVGISTPEPVKTEPAPGAAAAVVPSPTVPATTTTPPPADTAPESPGPSPVSMEVVRAKLTSLVQAGKQPEVKELLASFGATKLSEIPAERYGELMEKAGAIG